MKKTSAVILSAAVLLSSASANAMTDRSRSESRALRIPSYIQTLSDCYLKYCFANSAPDYGTNSNAPEYIPGQEAPEVSIPGQSEVSYERQVLELINEQRAKSGLPLLVWDDALANVARAHSEDMRDRRFFSHTNPDGLSPFDRIKGYGISYRSAGENIASGQETPEEVVNAWMNSSAHRANILKDSYTKMGVGYANGGTSRHYWTQLFSG